MSTIRQNFTRQQALYKAGNKVDLQTDSVICVDVWSRFCTCAADRIEEKMISDRTIDYKVS